ncbi:MAG: hypothetical protein MZW92_55670 [Comamonadaceae bacterium]|nr:hypothetical protein [Comamonadaceae bacterium]
MRQYTYNNIKQDNRNLLLGRDPTVDGMKTGYTEAAGYCLVASAQRDDAQRQAPAASAWCWAPPRARRAPARARSCSTGAAPAWDAVRLFEAGKPVATVPVWKGKRSRGASSARRARSSSPCRKGEGDKLQDRDRAHRPAGRAADRRASASAR